MKMVKVMNLEHYLQRKSGNKIHHLAQLKLFWAIELMKRKPIRVT